ncbi:MAG: cofactor-independent phosphoglycerate mutase [Ruminococcaceae bacterium]|nr:cofactor-independent phosphoglycerate mutase [Oscillospiraceae bacterium]
MKYLILVCDGMADYPIEELGGKTPMEKANKPFMDKLAKKSVCGSVSNVPEGMVPESDTANIAIMSYDPKIYSKGRSPLEALSMGLTMEDDDTAYRCNLVTLSEEDCDYNDRTIIDHSADEITTPEANELIKALEAHFGREGMHFYTGISYRHCMILKNGIEKYNFTRPHDILGEIIGQHMPKDKDGEMFYNIMRESYDILENHPVNTARRERGLKPANSAWFWSPGRRPSLPVFKDKWGLDATVISAVDLIKGIGLCAGMESIDVEGATGNVHTNYTGKANAAIDAFTRGRDLVYLHVEAPDECGHRAELDNKILSVEKIDKLILEPIYNHLKSTGEGFSILVLPDHPTPICKRTHTMEPVPFFIYSSDKESNGIDMYSEKNCLDTGLYIADGYKLLDTFIRK